MSATPFTASPELAADVERAVNLRSARPERGGTELRFLCPLHPDSNPSARYSPVKQIWRCDVCQAGGGILNLADALEVRRDQRPVTIAPKTESRTATYDYLDEHGTLVFQVVRYEPKRFVQRAPDGSGWTYRLDGVRRIPYNLPNVLSVVSANKTAPGAWPVFVVEGEKDADGVNALGLCATTSPMGAGKWRDEYAPHFAGGYVVIVPDKDEPGRKHAGQVARSLSGTAATVKVLTLPGPGKDVSDWLSAGGTREEMEALASAAPTWLPQDEHTPGGLQYVRFGDFLSETLPEARWQCVDVLREETFGFITGPEKNLKSYIAQNIAEAITTGGLFLGTYHCPSEQPVLYVQFESGRRAFRKRLSGIRDSLPPDKQTLFDRNLIVVTNQQVLLDDETSAARLEDVIAKTNPALVIIDPLQQTVSDGGNENDNSAMNALCRRLKGYRDTYKCSVLVVHHSDKTGNPLRGASSLRGNWETLVVLEREEPESPRVKVQIRHKEDPAVEKFWAECDFRTGRMTATGPVEGRTTHDQKLHDWMLGQGGMVTIPSAAETFGVPLETMRGRFKALEIRGLAEEVQPASGRAAALYQAKKVMAA